jgi:hypothetical protein
MNGAVAIAGSRTGRLRLVVGIAIGLLLPLVAGEAYVRLLPPADLKPYLGDSYSRSGIYRPDPVLRVDYRSPDDFVPSDGTPRLRDLKPLNVDRTWLFFGVSFAGGMSRWAGNSLPSHRVLFFRETGDEFHMRVAQARLLLENGLRPERMFFPVIPVEFARYVLRPLSWVDVTRQGSIAYRIRMPGWPLDALLAHSWLARVAWVRSKLHLASPTYRLSRITESVPQTVIDDFESMLGALGELSRKHNVPATIVLLPDRRQILGSSNFELQDKMSALARKAGLDVFNPRAAFLSYPDKRALYLPDWHYTPLGQGLLFDGLMAHLRQSSP